MKYDFDIYQYDGQFYRFLGKRSVGKKRGVWQITCSQKEYYKSETGQYLFCPSALFLKLHEGESLIISFGQEDRNAVTISPTIPYYYTKF